VKGGGENYDQSFSNRPLVFMTMAFSAGNAFAVSVSATGGVTTIAGLTKDQMMLMLDNMMKIDAW